MRTIICITTQTIWNAALESGIYAHSTITSSLESVGFIHATTPRQTMDIVQRFINHESIVLLLIDRDRIKAPVKFEAARSGRKGLFPHIYGSLNIDAIYGIVPVNKDSSGAFVAPQELIEVAE